CDGKKGSLTLDHDENVLGTADYLSPEQAINSHEVDTRADIYSLGCTFYYLLTGHPPFDEGSLSQRLLMHQKEAPPSIFVDRPDAPNDLVNICVRMMVKEAKGRYQTCREVSKVLSDWLSSQGRKVPTGGSSAKLATVGTARQAAGNVAAGRPTTRPTSRRTPGKTSRRSTSDPAPPVPGDTLTSSADETAKTQSSHPSKPPIARPPVEAKERRGPPKLPVENDTPEGKLRTATPLDAIEAAPTDEFPEFSIEVKGPSSPGQAKADSRSKAPAKPSGPTQDSKQHGHQADVIEHVPAQPLWKKPLFWAAIGGSVIVFGGLIGLIVFLLTR
ncbi:MAG: hypothetical protein IIA67_04680, partial [Planctomycetes bacterium]|nr:hypothetical protein [Planctomycetota bacterium]